MLNRLGRIGGLFYLAFFKQQLLRAGLMTSLPTPADPMSRPVFEPITIDGEPLSETIIRERR